ncbi:MAG: type IV pilus secretin PilQ [Nitrosomonas sp.]|nr:type IV pilus secretin PilQ [Nitrosomonas sp.]MDP1950191.1 type IV pilus secretin PilQ [Nitrosomonas sp.]
MKLTTTMNKTLWLGFIFSLIMFQPAMAVDREPDTTLLTNAIKAVDVSTVQGGEMLVRVTLERAVGSAPAGVSLNNPVRIYFDLYNVSNSLGKNFLEINEGDLNSINIVQAGDRTRLVLNLSRLMNHEITVVDNTFLVKLQTVIESKSVGSAVHFAEDVPGEQRNSLRDIDFRRGTNGEGRIEVDLLQIGTGIDVRQQGEDLVVEFINTRLPSNLERRFNVVDFATPVQTIEAYKQGENVRLVVKSNGRWEHTARHADTRFILEVRALPEDEDELSRRNLKNGGYIGEKLSLNFQNVDVRAVLQVIADFTDLNIIASDTVGGSLTLRLKDVPWDQALDIVLQATGLDKRKTGNVIFVAPRDEMAARELLELESRLQISELEPVRTEIYHLNHRRVNSISFDGMLSKRGTINMDEISNSLTVTDIPVRLVEIKKRIHMLDVFERQVMIEARIVEAIDTFSRDLGARFGVENNKSSGDFNFKDTFNSVLPAAGVGALAGGPATLGLSLIKVNNSTLIDLELSALESDRKGRVISSPRVVTAHGVEAIIEQGDRVPFQQATSSGATSIRFVDATLSLKVKPLITFDNKVDMELSVNQDKIGQSINQFLPPPINTKQITTKVLVDNGGTVVIGGIFERTENEVINRIPLLGNIPILGHIFRNTATQDNKRELLVFVTPRILSEDLNLR